ncbi:hypothetical protein HHI36_007842 [Cryptolaemus montrouzieri]|uniref:Dihydropteridine reductase n=1 Tax=Cryptolaemus montrouzieri TaxID=559131 RepID=A0ABD2MQR4_9CUCU
MARRLVICGGAGCLGAYCVSHFKSNGFWVASIDINENKEADINILIDLEECLMTTDRMVLEALRIQLKNEKLVAVICTAGGWIGGNVQENFAQNCDKLLRQNVWSSIICTSVAYKFLGNNGMLILTGAKTALRSTPKMIGYGMAKNAVHHLAKSLAEKDSGLPQGARVVCVLPDILNTAFNRRMMPEADVTNWTPLLQVAEIYESWIDGDDPPRNGQFVLLNTNNLVTKAIPANEEGVPLNY